MNLDTFLLAMGAPAQNGANSLVSLIPLVAMLAIFYFLLVLPMKRKQQKVQTFLQALKVDDKVVTSGGIHGTITKIDGDTLDVRIAQNTTVRMSRNAVVGYQGQAPVDTNA